MRFQSPFRTFTFQSLLADEPLKGSNPGLVFLHKFGHPNSQIDDLRPWAYIAAPELKAVA